MYIRQKYIEAYNFKEQFKEDCDVIIRDLKEGCNKDKYIPEYTDKNGNYHPGTRGYEKVPSLDKQIGKDNAKKVIDLIEQRRDYYRFDRLESNFMASLALNDSPSTNPETVINYWKSMGVDITIDPRHYSFDDFWSEDNGYLDEENETGI